MGPLGVLTIVIIFCSLIPSRQTPSNAHNDVKNIEFINYNWQATSDYLELVRWKYQTNMTAENLKEYIRGLEDTLKKQKELWKEITTLEIHKLPNDNIKRQAVLFSQLLKTGILPTESFLELQELKRTMVSILSSTKIPSNEKGSPKLSLEDVQETLQSNRNITDLAYLWIKWADAVEEGAKHNFLRYVELLNEAASLHNFKDASEIWLRQYSEFANVKRLTKTWWNQIESLYKELHAFVRFKLQETYGNAISDEGAIPIHLLGNILGESWTNIANLVIPFSYNPHTEINSALKEQKHTSSSMAKNAADFMTSLSFPELPVSFWRNSMFEKPKTEQAMTGASYIYTFHSSNAIRALSIYPVTAESFFASHWLACKVQLWQLSQQAFIFRELSHPGLGDAISDTIVLSVKTAPYLNRLAISAANALNKDRRISILLYDALNTVVLLTYSYTVELWIWGVLSGDIPPERYNSAWWKLKLEYQGVQPPVPRKEDHFDPVMNVNILEEGYHFRVYVSKLLAFQIFRTLCTEAGAYLGKNSGKQLQECDIYGSSEAGKVLRQVARLGTSKSLLNTLEMLTGERSVNTSAMMEYYEPLMIWLKDENKKNGVKTGWITPDSKKKNVLRFDVDVIV